MSNVSIITTIIIGAISSFIATIVYLMIVKYITKVVLPWYRNLVYRGVSLNGQWTYKVNYSQSDFQEITLDFIQSADTIIGSMIIHKEISGKTQLENHTINGYIQDRFVVLTARPAHPNGIWHHVFLLETVEEVIGLELIGKILFYNKTNKGIDADPLTFKRLTS